MDCWVQRCGVGLVLKICKRTWYSRGESSTPTILRGALRQDREIGGKPVIKPKLDAITKFFNSIFLLTTSPSPHP